jgi:hypothetical protein
MSTRRTRPPRTRKSRSRESEGPAVAVASIPSSVPPSAEPVEPRATEGDELAALDAGWD